MPIARTKMQTGPSLAEQIITLVENAKMITWNKRVEETILPSYIPPKTILQGHLWFRWTKMHATKDKYYSGRDGRDVYHFVLPTPLTLYILTPEGDISISLEPTKGKISYC